MSHQIVRVDGANLAAVNQSVHLSSTLDIRGSGENYFPTSASASGSNPPETWWCSWNLGTNQEVEFRGAIDGLIQAGQAKLLNADTTSMREAMAEESQIRISPPSPT